MVMNDNAKPWDILNPSIPKVSKELAEERMSICHSCPSLMAGMCRECFCIMKVKTTLSNAYCPLGKWTASNENTI
jgi:hypothetical protein